MAITIDWGTKIINVPKADTQLVQSSPTEIRQLDLDNFRLTLNDLQDDATGMAYDTTHRHVAPITVGGVTLARVVEIINGYTVTFEDGQYAVNLVGANSNVGDVVNVNQVSIRSANSAGLTFSDQINEQSYLGYVWIDTNLGLPGTQFPRGTPTDPSDNWLDAHVIMNRLNLHRVRMFGTETPNVLTNHELVGNGPSLTTVILSGTAVTTGALVEQCSLVGTMKGGMQLKECALSDITDFEGFAYICALGGTITVPAALTDQIRFINCFSDLTVAQTPVLDLNGANLPVVIRNYTGSIKLTNLTAAGTTVSIDMLSGFVELDATCTAGTVDIRGMAAVVDNSGAGCTVTTDETVTNLVTDTSITQQDKDEIVNRIVPSVWAASS